MERARTTIIQKMLQKLKGRIVEHRVKVTVGIKVINVNKEEGMRTVIWKRQIDQVYTYRYLGNILT